MLVQNTKGDIVQRGTSASIFLTNAGYRSFIYSKFHVSPPVDMKSAFVALIVFNKGNISSLLGPAETLARLKGVLPTQMIMMTPSYPLLPIIQWLLFWNLSTYCQPIRHWAPDITTTKNVYYNKKNHCNNIEVIAIVYAKCCNKIWDNKFVLQKNFCCNKP